MKTLYKVAYLLLLPLSLAAANTPIEDGQGAIEKKRTVIKMFDVDQKDKLLIDNQFGQVNVDLWDKNEIRVQIVITANANTDSRAQDFLNTVEITDKREGDQITLKTELQKQSSSWTNWGNGNGEKNYVRIDYTVQMPRNNALTVRNKFGNTHVATFQAPLNIYTRYGNFTAQQLSGRQNDIDVAFGNADIRNMDAGKLAIAYSNLELDKANVLVLNNKFGKLKIGEVGKIDANISYSGARIGTLRESCKMKLDFSGGFQIEQLKSADNVDIQANYSSVALPINPETGYDFDVSVTYGGFKYPNGQNLLLTTQPNDENRPGKSRQYIGKIGRGSGPRVRVVSKFGDVTFR
ncbi:DUF4097 family beta strand repeat protein [Rudanella paleaurantiibacter]|uniref:DUF4097 family beta strand repeat protein n=1 Tax=Rudanella paleaurantiibacter TaxID=2614655 RepID=A0A7J5TTT6_9BACT|nr:DUF4097 family beta strand repeat-containing protein [Rudanella paleaurantiibacter]KAB7725400.1 DUF4097 family beta strand repeat protein [Rudanella paleaurantiibacter]